jgi:MoxR-like ATPase
VLRSQFFTSKVSEKATMKVVKVSSDVGELIERFNSAFDVISGRLVNRAEEIEAIKYCFLTRGHLLLEGAPGVAKSLLARLAFKVITADTEKKPLVIYRKQLMANTLPDEIFGPANIKSLREDSTWTFNTTGMLPEAHFAYLDEIYRASDSLLPSMMGILNERTFHNGTVEQKCPLVSAIGTTNFVTDRPELEAFHDRWLIRCYVKPADSSNARKRILSLFLEEDDADSIEIPDPLSMAELARLQKMVRDIELTEEFLDLYDNMVSKYKSSVPAGCYVSDRRFCQAARLIQCAILLESGGENFERVSPTVISAARYGIIRESSKDHTQAFENAISEVIGNVERMEKEEPEIAAIEETVNRYFKRFDESMSKEKKMSMLEKAVAAAERLNNLPPEDQFTLPKNVDRLRKCSKKLEELKSSLQDSLGIIPKTTL